VDVTACAVSVQSQVPNAGNAFSHLEIRSRYRFGHGTVISISFQVMKIMITSHSIDPKIRKANELTGTRLKTAKQASPVTLANSMNPVG
jgi:hypothetical protein